jgi:chromosome segregation ATPase
MTRTTSVLGLVFLGTFLLAGCEDRVCQEALNGCRSQLTEQQAVVTKHVATINDLKVQLAQAETKVQDLSKEIDTVKGGKGAKGGEQKKAEAKAPGTQAEKKEPAAKTEAKTETKAGTKTEAKTETKTEAQTATKTATKTEAKTAMKTETKTGTKTEAKTGTKTEAKTGTQTGTKTEAKK